MLRRATSMIGYNIAANDGEIGHVEDFYFNTDEVGDSSWAIRYMMVDTGFWIFGRKVLVAPDALGTPDWDSQMMPVDLTKEQIKESPELDFNRPITREYEQTLRGYYGWPVYWGAPPMTPTPGVGTARDAHLASHLETRSHIGEGREEVPEEVATAVREGERPHIYSVNDLTSKFSFRATDGDIGHVEDVFIDDYNWVIRYLLIDTGDWMPGRKVLIAPEWISRLDFEDNTAEVKLTQEQVENSPEFEPGGPLNRDYEGRLYDYYGYRTYW